MLGFAFSEYYAENHLGLYQNVLCIVFGLQIPNYCMSDTTIVSRDDQIGDSRLVSNDQPLVLNRVTEHRVRSRPSDVSTVIFSPLDGQGDIRDAARKRFFEDLLELTVTDGDVKLFVMNAQELCRLVKQGLKVLGFNGAEFPLVLVWEG